MTVIKNPSQRWPITFAHFKRFSGRHIQHFRDNRFKSLWNDLSNSLNGRVRYRTYDFHRNTAFDYYTRYWPKIALWHSRHRQRQKCRHFLSSHMSSTSPRVKQALSPYEIRLRFFFSKTRDSFVKIGPTEIQTPSGDTSNSETFLLRKKFSNSFVHRSPDMMTISPWIHIWRVKLPLFFLSHLSSAIPSSLHSRPAHLGYILHT